MRVEPQDVVFKRKRDIDWRKAPLWANLAVLTHDGNIAYLDHNLPSTKCLVMFEGEGRVLTSASWHNWNLAPVLSRRVRNYSNKEDCLVDRNIFITQAFALMNTTSPKYNVFGAMYDAGCRFPEQD